MVNKKTIKIYYDTGADINTLKKQLFLVEFWIEYYDISAAILDT